MNTTHQYIIKDGAVLLLPVLLLLIARTVYLGDDIYTAAAAGDSLTKTTITALSYTIAAALLITRFDAFLRVSRRLAAYILYTIIALVSASWSYYPDLVIMRVFHMVGLLLVASCLAIWARSKKHNTITVLLLFSFATLSLSLYYVFFFPDRGIINADWYDGEWGASGSRWVGVTNHPNLLGGLAFIGAWASISSITSSRSKYIRATSALTMILALIALKGSDSRSAQLSVILLFVISWPLNDPNVRSLPDIFHSRRLWLSLLLLISATLLYFLVIAEQLDSSQTLVREGANDALSGRTDIWSLGFTAIAERPILGWSFDLLNTYWDLHDRIWLFPHFHNGYIDIAVKGGLIEFTLFIIALVIFWLAIIRHYTRNQTATKSYILLFLCTAFYNISETSFDRENLVWVVLFSFWPVVALPLRDATESPPRAIGRHPSRHLRNSRYRQSGLCKAESNEKGD